MFDSDPTGEPDHRARLLDAVSEAVTKKGYAQTTIADVVRAARVSKRTFYECFADKEECFLAAYASHSERLLSEITKAVLAENDIEARLHAAARAYVTLLEEQPARTRTFLIEIQAAGPKALKLRRSLQRRFAEFMIMMVEAARKQRPDLPSLSPAMAAAMVGGINELLLLTAEDARMGFAEVGNTAVQLVRAVLTVPQGPLVPKADVKPPKIRARR